LYAGARVFAYPSLAEGFGFPVLEAMACGAPVVASDTSSLRDNLTDAAVLVAPEDVHALTAALQRMLKDEAWRTDKVAAGLARAQTFHWSHFAQATASCYEEIGARKSPGRMLAR
jgi:glycosyltransferase involved in cell wall biosynthesis